MLVELKVPHSEHRELQIIGLAFRGKGIVIIPIKVRATTCRQRRILPRVCSTYAAMRQSEFGR